MATRFDALDELFDDALELPIKGRDGAIRTYRIPSPTAESGLRISRMTVLAMRAIGGGSEVDAEALNDEEELDLLADALGPAQAEMQADGVDWAWLRHAGLTAVIWITQGPDSAGTYWRAAGDPTRLAPPNRAARRAKPSSGSAAASTTKRRASGSSTTARRATKSAPKASRA
jgi:hypothetical protein